MTSRKKKSLHHEATADAVETLAVDVGVKKHDLLGTENLATPVLNAKTVPPEKKGRRAKNARPVKNVGRVKNELSADLVNQWEPNVLHVALLHATAVKLLSSPVTAATREHLESLRSLQTFRRGKKRSALCR